MERQIPRYFGFQWWWLLLIFIAEITLGYTFKLTAAWPSIVEFWLFFQLLWLKRGDSKSWMLYFQSIYLLSTLIRLASASWHPGNAGSIVLASAVAIGTVCALCAIFSAETSMERQFDDPPNRYFTLSTWMVLFFSVFYFQYHFHALYKEQQAAGLAAKRNQLATPSQA